MAFLGINKNNFDDVMISLTIMISSITFFKTPFEGYFHYLIFLIYFPFFIRRYGWQTLPFKFLLIPMIFSLYNLFTKNCELFGFVKIFMGMLLSVTFYNYVIIHYQFNLEKLLNIYLKGIIICCYIGIVQVISYNIGFSPGYNFSFILNKWGVVPGSIFGLRVNSIFSEPSQFAIVLLPAAFIASRNILFRDYKFLNIWQSYLIILSLILTTASTGYIGIFFSLVLIAINYGRFANFIIILGISFLGFYLFYIYVPDFKTRVDAAVNLWIRDQYTIDDINTSSFVQYNNFHVSFENFKEHPLFGTGLGSYPGAYEKYSLTNAADFLIKEGFDFNSQDGNSLFFRSMAEMGIAGVLFWLLLIARFFVRRNQNDPSDDTWIYSGAMLAIIFGYLMRQGNYFLNGFPFFVLMYYYIGSRYKTQKLTAKEAESPGVEMAKTGA